MKKYLTTIILTIALTGCERLTIRERFTDAEISPDGKIGLFVFKKEHYYPGSIGILGPGRPDRYTVNLSLIGSYDLTSGEVRVLYRRDNGDRYVNESLDFHIGGIFGSRAWVTGNDQNFYWLDRNSGALTTVPLKQEMLARGREFGEINLVDEMGTLIIATKSLGQSMNYAAPQEIWLRRSNGEYERLLDTLTGSGGDYGFKDNEFYFYSQKERTYVAYNIDSRAKRNADQEEVPHRRNYDMVVDFMTDDHGSPQPRVGRKTNGKWTYQEAQIDTSELR